MFLYYRLNKKAALNLTWENIVKIILVLAIIVFGVWIAYKGAGTIKNIFSRI